MDAIETPRKQFALSDVVALGLGAVAVVAMGLHYIVNVDTAAGKQDSFFFAAVVLLIGMMAAGLIRVLSDSMAQVPLGIWVAIFAAGLMQLFTIFVVGSVVWVADGVLSPNGAIFAAGLAGLTVAGYFGCQATGDWKVSARTEGYTFAGFVVLQGLFIVGLKLQVWPDMARVISELR